MRDKGRAAKQKGEFHGQAKLTNDNIVEIFRLHNLGLKQACIGKMFNVTSTNIGKILNSKRWQHVKV